MNEKTLERLIIDRKLNELTPDSSELLDAYLTLQPRHNSLADELDATIDLAQRAMTCHPATDELPPPRFLEMQQQRPVPIRNLALVRPWAVAAGLILAFLAGGEWAPRFTTDSVPTVQMASTDTPTTEQGGGGIWSLRRIHTTNQNDSTAKQPVRWLSPVAWPQNGDRS